MEKRDFDFWLLPEGALDSSGNPDGSWILQHLAQLPPQEAERIVDHLIEIGDYYQAARCLEIQSQQQLGPMISGDELTASNRPYFGRFHRNIRDLLKAGALYYRAKRPAASRAIAQRALVFVEDALRQMRPFNRDSLPELYCVSLGFELAGHCCNSVNSTIGLDYYKAAEEYSEQSIELDAQEVEHWSHHPVTQTVIGCLQSVIETKGVDGKLIESLFAHDHRRRLDTAKALLC